MAVLLLQRLQLALALAPAADVASSVAAAGAHSDADVDADAVAVATGAGSTATAVVRCLVESSHGDTHSYTVLVCMRLGSVAGAWPLPSALLHDASSCDRRPPWRRRRRRVGT